MSQEYGNVDCDGYGDYGNDSGDGNDDDGNGDGNDGGGNDTGDGDRHQMVVGFNDQQKPGVEKGISFVQGDSLVIYYFLPNASLLLPVDPFLPVQLGICQILIT